MWSDISVFLIQKKGLRKQTFSVTAGLDSTSAVKKAFEENPLYPGGQSFLMSESPTEWAFSSH